MKINTIKVAVLMALSLVGVNELNAQHTFGGVTTVIVRSNSDNSNHEEPILFQVGQNSNSLRDFRLKVDKIESTFNTGLRVGKYLVVSEDGVFGGAIQAKQLIAHNLIRTKNIAISTTGTRRGEEAFHIFDGNFRIDNGAIKSNAPVILHPGVDNKEDDYVSFRNSENSEMARVKDGTFTVKGGNTFQSYGNLSLRANANGKQYGTIFFKDGSNREMARLERGKLTLDQISLNVTTFPDYVFAKEYHLMPLNEVASYIKENKHLPNMPTEKEVVKEGMNVGQINTLLVEKVEELTLYTIEQEEKIQAQEKTMKALLQKLEALETLVKSKK
ncbi:hypothetical protein V2550_11920 [Tenacibaculum maritimum]|uniref:hypothetical protein n=1 Tax=Tenacibaculum maritimum TaxID=107401 RepID=UPI003875BF5C